MVSDSKLVSKYCAVKKGAKDRKIPFNLSLKKLKQLMNKKRCFYTGVEFNPEVPALCLSIDRVDNDQGYIDSNVVACTVEINQQKSNINLKNLEIIIRKINQFTKKKEHAKKIMAKTVSKKTVQNSTSGSKSRSASSRANVS